MKAIGKGFWVFWVVLAGAAGLFSASTLQAGGVAEVKFTESTITITPQSGFDTIAVEVSNAAGVAVLNKKVSAYEEALPLSDFSSITDGPYRINLSAETGEGIEALGRVEDGREAKVYTLKKVVNQSETFQIENGKILNSTLIEE